MNACAVCRFCFNVDWGMEGSGYKSRNAYQGSGYKSRNAYQGSGYKSRNAYQESHRMHALV